MACKYKGVTFGGDPELKAKMQGRAEGHRVMDHFMQGIYWEKSEVKGCAIGCLSTGAASFGRSNGQGSGAEAIACEFQIPYWLARLAETAFEGRDKDGAIAWVEKFVSAIPVGVELSDDTVYGWAEEFGVLRDNWGAHNEPLILEKLASITPDEEQEQVKEMLDQLGKRTDAEADFFKKFRAARQKERDSVKAGGRN